MKTRIAPTPSGFLHAGNGAAFVLAWKLAKAAGGKVLLRIDDLDAERARPEYVQDIFDTLAWLDVEWDEGPRTPAEFEQRWSQHRRIASYEAMVQELRATGKLYACDCSRKAITERAGNTEYDGHCRERGLNMDLPKVAWRLRLPENTSVQLASWPEGTLRDFLLDVPDPVLRQRNGRPAYQVASLADDLHFGVDTIVRGLDLLPSTLVQLHIAQLLGRTMFSEVKFLHHPLVVGVDGEKLSKSSGAISLRHWRETGRPAGAVHALAEQLLAAYRQGANAPVGLG